MWSRRVGGGLLLVCLAFTSACSLNTLDVPAVVSNTDKNISENPKSSPIAQQPQPTPPPLMSPELAPIIGPAVPVIATNPDPETQPPALESIVPAADVEPATNDRADADAPVTETAPVVVIAPVASESDSASAHEDLPPTRTDQVVIENPNSRTPVNPAAEAVIPNTLIGSASEVAEISEPELTRSPADVTTPTSVEPSVQPIIITTPPVIESGGAEHTPVTTPEGYQDAQGDAEEDIIVSGSCSGRKKAGVIWYDKRDKNKKGNSSANCKNDKYEFKLKFKKKDAPYIFVQSVSY